ncbi:MAG: putative 4-hydroxybenzoate polyprenyltransferase [Bacteroidales bacterium]|nr:putative 4-hydroxybenzoate polyprenyltransferase [Bacteroidales bacterium]MDD4217499.1 putative 4-hydroxybenzoate polyprenyltransferase [Bacteroidales bacterium]MDY0140920.1 4-hydroxybenzoate octaprenyltransferase [Bacteroidales bacterium]
MRNKIKSYLSLIKFSHTVFAMPFALTAYFMAIKEPGQIFEWRTLILVLLSMIFARNSAMAFNRYTDRFIDAKNPRTETREIPKKIITAKNALIFTIINSVLFIISASFINIYTLILSPLALLIVLGYSYTKRFTFLSHIFLGLGLAIAPAGAYIAVTGTFSFAIMMLSASVLLWTAGFDIIYSLQDEEFDKKYKLFSIPAKLGRKSSLWISTILHFIAVMFLLFWAILMSANFIQWIGIGVFTALLVHQHLIVKPNDISKVNIAFGTTNGIASICLAVATIISLFY